MSTFKSALSSLTGFTFFKNLNIGGKLTIGFGILVILTLAVAGLSYLGSVPATENIDRTDELRVPTALTSARAQADLLRMLSNVRGYLALGDETYRDSYNQSAQAFAADLEELNRLSPYFDAENNRRLHDLEAAFAEWSALPDRLFELRNDQLDREPAYRLLATDGSRLAGTVLIDVNSLIELQSQREASDENIQMLGEMAEYQGTFASMFSALRGYVTTRNRIYRQEYDVNLTANQFAWEKLEARRPLLTPTQRDTLDSIAENREDFLNLIPDQVFEQLEGERWREDLYLFRTEAVPLAEEMEQLLGEITDDQQALLRTDLNTGRAGLAQANQLTLLGGIVALILGLVMAFFFRSNIAGPVRRLTTVAEQIREGDLEAKAAVESKDEIGILASTFNNMTSQLRQTLTQVRREKKRADDLLEVVIPIGIELASEKDFNRLLEKMLLEAKMFCHADAGTLYLRTKDNQLEYVIVRDDVQQLAMGGTTEQPVPFAPLPLYDETGAPNDRYIATRAVLDRQSINIANVDEVGGFDFSGPEGRIVEVDERATSILAIPLENSEGDVLGVMQLVDAEDPESGQASAFDQNLQQMMESFSSLAVAALQAYIREQELRRQIQQLRIEIDQAKKARQVAEITETDYFQDLHKRAKELRERVKGEDSESQD
ncbi:MAG: HAMP domain-containing protein [Anaerolineae bacterium]